MIKITGKLTRLLWLGNFIMWIVISVMNELYFVAAAQIIWVVIWILDFFGDFNDRI